MLLLGIALHGCRPEPSDSEPPDSETPARSPAASVPDHQDPSAMPDTPDDSLRMTTQAPDRVPAGRPVPVTIRAQNVTDRTLSLHLTGRDIAFDVIVDRPDGTPVWRRLEGEVIRAILRLDTLAPGEALVLEATWDQRSDAGQPVPPGEYRVHGEILTETGSLRTPVRTITITP